MAVIEIFNNSSGENKSAVNVSQKFLSFFNCSNPVFLHIHACCHIKEQNCLYMEFIGISVSSITLETHHCTSYGFHILLSREAAVYFCRGSQASIYICVSVCVCVGFSAVACGQ